MKTMNVIGIDVSKEKLDCLWLRDLATGKAKSKVVPNQPSGHQALLAWAEKTLGCPAAAIWFVMEATGVYHETLAMALNEAGAPVAVVNPARLRDYAKALGQRAKTDQRDSYAIAHYGCTQALIRWQPELPEVRELKALLARLAAVEKDTQREANRLEKATVSQASAIVSDSIRAMLAALTAEKARLEHLIDDHIAGHPTLKQDAALLQSIPGVGAVLSRYLTMTYRSREFQRAAQMAAYLGVVPVAYESGSSVRGRPHLSKAGSGVIRAKLYMPAVVATRCNPQARALYQRLLRNGKTKMAALGAVMRKLVHMCYGVLKHRQAYSPSAA